MINSMISTTPKLAEGHTLPTKPVYWLIWILDADTRKSHHSRLSYSKLLTPREASMQAYGIPPTDNMVFFNLSPRVAEMRKMMTQIGKLWQEAGGK